MIQFNLLPDVKLEYLKAERIKRLVATVSILASVVAIAVFALLLITVDVLQKKNLNDLNSDIKTKSAKLESTPDLSKILTIQNQLGALTGLHDAKPVASRLYPYLGQIIPSSVTTNNVTVDFVAHTIAIAGNGPSLDSVNTFVDTLKFTNYTTDASNTPTKAFSNVVLAGFNRSSATATYNITLSYDPIIFDITQTVKLVVPKSVTTRSITEQPTILFKSTEVKE